jgi:hypothetical protein
VSARLNIGRLFFAAIIEVLGLIFHGIADLKSSYKGCGRSMKEGRKKPTLKKASVSIFSNALT